MGNSDGRQHMALSAQTWMGIGSVMPALRSVSTTRLLSPHWFQLRTGRGTFLPRTCRETKQNWDLKSMSAER